MNTVEVTHVDADVQVHVRDVGDVTSAVVEATVGRQTVEAVVDSSRGGRGPQGQVGPVGPAGTSVSVHWSTNPPSPSDGNVGDLWVVTETP